MRGTKYLNEIMQDIELSTEKNNLILAPIGSGKTYYIMNELRLNKKVLYLCDNDNLKFQCEQEINTYSNNKRLQHEGFNKTETYICTYKEFGSRIRLDVTDDFIYQFDLIVADEIHSLAEYSEFNKDRDLSHALNFLLSIQQIPIILFTATPFYIEKLKSDNINLFNNLNIIDFMNNKEIRRYTELLIDYINNISQIGTYLKKYETGFKFANLKCLIYTKQIRDMLKIENICKDLGLRPICIWSKNNDKYELTEEQIKVKEHLLTAKDKDNNFINELKEPYNVLIINKASETGINIKDKDMKLCIVNSINQTEITQSRGRIRHDVDLLVVKTKSDKLPPLKITVNDKYLNRWLTKNEFELLMETYNIMNSRSKNIGMRAFRNLLYKNKYKIEDKRIRKDNKQNRVYMILEIKN